MNCKEWKDEMDVQSKNVIVAYDKLITHMNLLPTITDAEDQDVEELAAITVVRLNRMNKNIEELFK